MGEEICVHSLYAVQFATVTVFALAYPLGALLALVNNLIEIRSDAFKLVQVFQTARFLSW